MKFKILKRIAYHLMCLRDKLGLRILFLFSPSMKRLIQAVKQDDFDRDIDPELRRLVEERLSGKIQDAREPELVPRRTMLFLSDKEGGCNFITAWRFRRRIRKMYKWASDRGLSAFMADYTTPFGLLALETLLKLQASGERFSLYCVKCNGIGARKSYRLIPETMEELYQLLGRSTYSYGHLSHREIVGRILPKVGVFCTESKLGVDKEWISESLLRSWME